MLWEAALCMSCISDANQEALAPHLQLPTHRPRPEMLELEGLWNPS